LQIKIYIWKLKHRQNNAVQVVSLNNISHEASPDFLIKKNYIYIYKNGLCNAHPALCSTFLKTSYCIIAVTRRF
jgi:hypothetical protein